MVWSAPYVRVSTSSQTTDNQTIELKRYCERQDWKIIKTYADTGISEASRERPALDEMLADATAQKFDVLLVWKIDHLARSISHLLDILKQLKIADVGFCSMTESQCWYSRRLQRLQTFTRHRSPEI